MQQLFVGVSQGRMGPATGGKEPVSPALRSLVSLKLIEHLTQWGEELTLRVLN